MVAGRIWLRGQSTADCRINKRYSFSYESFPSIFAIIGMVVMWFYPLTNKKMMEIEQELTARRKSAGDSNESVSNE